MLYMVANRKIFYDQWSKGPLGVVSKSIKTILFSTHLDYKLPDYMIYLPN